MTKDFLMVVVWYFTEMALTEMRGFFGSSPFFFAVWVARVAAVVAVIDLCIRVFV